MTTTVDESAMDDAHHEDEFLSFFNDDGDGFDMDFDVDSPRHGSGTGHGELALPPHNDTKGHGPERAFPADTNAFPAKDDEYCSDHSSQSTVSDSSYSTQSSSQNFPSAHDFYQRAAPDPRSPDTDAAGDDSDVSASSYESRESPLVRPRHSFVHTAHTAPDPKKGLVVNPAHPHNRVNMLPMPMMPFMNHSPFVMPAGSPQYPLAVPMLPTHAHKQQQQHPLQLPPQPSPVVKTEVKRQRKEERLMKNRESATQSRLRRKHEYDNMKVYVKELEDKIHSLENGLASSHTECKSLREQNAFLQDMIRKQFDVTHSSKAPPTHEIKMEVQKPVSDPTTDSGSAMGTVTGTLPRFVDDAGQEASSSMGKKRGIDNVEAPENRSPARKTPFVKISPAMMMTVAVMFCLATCLNPAGFSATSETATGAGVPYVGRTVLTSQTSNITSVVDVWQYVANVFLNFVVLGVLGVGVSTLHASFASGGVVQGIEHAVRSMLPGCLVLPGAKAKDS